MAWLANTFEWSTFLVGNSSSSQSLGAPRPRYPSHIGLLARALAVSRRAAKKTEHGISPNVVVGCNTW
jgi:predicted transcriptional regulator